MRAESAARIVKLGLINFWRNRGLSFAATLIMTLTLLIISFFVVSTLAVGKTTSSIRERMDMSIYFNETISVDQIASLQKDLGSRSDVRQIKYVSKDDALEICKKNPQCAKAIAFTDLNKNPLPRSLEVKASQPEKLQEIASFIQDGQYKAYVRGLSYQQNQVTIERLIAITAFMKEFGWLICTIFILISILVSLNTIGLTIFSRRDEIEIMRLVGANDAFIKVPFIIEGFLQGFFATMISMGGVWVGIAVLAPRIKHYLGETTTRTMINFFWDNFWLMLALELIVGITIGIVCSLISIRKHLRV